MAIGVSAVIALSIRGDLKPLQRAFVDFRAKQAPFATALALTTLAKGVQAAEGAEIAKTFDHPTPFTLNAIAISPATKSKPIAVVFPKDVQAAYLDPYVNGGDRSLGGKQGMLVPIDAATNQYGNLTKGQLARLKGKPGVFIGPVRTKSGRTINGVWQRATGGKPAQVRGGKAQRAKPTSSLKLLIEFKDTTEAPKHLDFYERANAYLRRNAAREFDVAMRKAFATRRR